MRFGGQIALALVAIVGLVAGVTYVSQYRVAPPPKPKASVAEPLIQEVAKELKFFEPIVQWEPRSAGEFELETEAFRDFWFENPSPVEIELGLISFSCKCSGMSLCVLTGDNWKRYQRYAVGSAAGQVLAGLNGFLAGLTQLGAAEDNLIQSKLHGLELNWKPIKDRQTSVPVPSGGGGLVRVSWKGRAGKRGDERLSVRLWEQPNIKPSPRKETDLEMVVTLVPVLRALPPEVEFKEELYPQTERTADFVVWSSVRTGFPLTATESTNDPCVKCTWTPMPFAATQGLAQLGQEKGAPPIRPLYAYHVQVTIKERVDNNIQMELGPFSRKIVLKSDPGVEESFVTIKGRVLGEITVLGPKEHAGTIPMGIFKTSEGKTSVVKLSANQPGLELQFERIEPPTVSYVRFKHLKKLEGSGEPRWELAIDVPPGSPAGKIPPHTAAVLKIDGPSPRFIRIPITGMVTQ